MCTECGSISEMTYVELFDSHLRVAARVRPGPYTAWIRNISVGACPHAWEPEAWAHGFAPAPRGPGYIHAQQLASFREAIVSAAQVDPRGAAELVQYLLRHTIYARSSMPDFEDVESFASQAEFRSWFQRLKGGTVAGAWSTSDLDDTVFAPERRRGLGR
jgi:hypothetical protein